MPSRPCTPTLASLSSLVSATDTTKKYMKPHVTTTALANTATEVTTSFMPYLMNSQETSIFSPLVCIPDVCNTNPSSPCCVLFLLHFWQAVSCYPPCSLLFHHTFNSPSASSNFSPLLFAHFLWCLSELQSKSKPTKYFLSPPCKTWFAWATVITSLLSYFVPWWPPRILWTLHLCHPHIAPPDYSCSHVCSSSYLKGSTTATNNFACSLHSSFSWGKAAKEKGCKTRTEYSRLTSSQKKRRVGAYFGQWVPLPCWDKACEGSGAGLRAGRRVQPPRAVGTPFLWEVETVKQERTSKELLKKLLALFLPQLCSLSCWRATVWAAPHAWDTAPWALLRKSVPGGWTSMGLSSSCPLQCLTRKASI